MSTNQKTNLDIHELARKAFQGTDGGTAEDFTVSVSFQSRPKHYDFPLVIEQWHSNLTNNKSRYFGAAETWFSRETGAVIYEEFSRNGEFHRENGPALTYFNPETGEITKQRFFRSGEEYFPHQDANHDPMI